jgi:hypothetical protein
MKAARRIEASPEPQEGPDQEALRLFVRVVESEGAFDKETSEAVRLAFRKYLDAAGTRGLEDCIGLRVHRGQRSFATQFAEQKRLHAFSDAWHAMVGCDGLSPWRRCEVLALQMGEFKEAELSDWIKKGVPKNASRLWRAFFRIFTAIETPPAQSTGRVLEAIRRAGVLPRDPELPRDRDLAEVQRTELE